jgi:hypothetical protein
MQKPVELYTDVFNHTNTQEEKLILELGKDHFACLVKNRETDAVEALELFELEDVNFDWNDTFYEVRSHSRILGRTYGQTHVFMNLEEAMILPASKMSTQAAEDYLSALYGDQGAHTIRFDKLSTEENIVNVYRIPNNIIDLISRNFLLVTSQHTYTCVLDEIAAKTHQHLSNFVSIQLYKSNMILSVLKNHKLQLIQSFPMNSEGDILYHLMNCCRQLDISLNTVQVELSGHFDTKDSLMEQLKKVVAKITLEAVASEGVFLLPDAQKHPMHFYAPYYKLSV